MNLARLLGSRLVHLDVEECSEEMLRQQSYAMVVLYGIRLLAQASLGKLSTNEGLNIPRPMRVDQSG